MPRDRRTLAILIHVAGYLVVVATCAAVNLGHGPERLWFLWVAAGWGIGVAAHALSLWLRPTHRRGRVFNHPKARGLIVHLFAYVAVVVLLFIVNMTVTPKLWWFQWVALGWGTGVLAHGWCMFFRKRDRADDSPHPRRRRARRRKGEPS